MAWRSLLTIVALIATSCVANDPSDGDNAALDSSEPADTSAIESEPGGDAVLTMTAESDDGDSDEKVPVEILIEVGENLGQRVDELALFGYRGRPLADAEQGLIPNLGERYPGLSINQRSLVWGVDSGAILLSADGDPEVIKEAAALLGQSTTWILADEGWMAALYPGGLVDGSEMRTLVETILWVMNPDEACVRSLEACPFGAAVGYPPPPPALVVNAETISEGAPLAFVTLDRASNVAASSGTISWVLDGQAYSAAGGEDRLAETPPRGPAVTAVGFGSFVFVVDPTGSSNGEPAIVARPCCDQPDAAVWPIPNGWRVEGMAVAGHFGQQNLGLLLTIELPDDQARAVVLELDEDLLSGAPASSDVDLSQLVPVNSAGTRWSEPRRTSDGLITVIEERNGDWILVGDALGASVEMARSSERILSHAVSAGAHDVVLITKNDTGTQMWWSRDGELTEVESDATSVAWYGSWLR